MLQGENSGLLWVVGRRPGLGRDYFCEDYSRLLNSTGEIRNPRPKSDTKTKIQNPKNRNAESISFGIFRNTDHCIPISFSHFTKATCPAIASRPSQPHRARNRTFSGALLVEPRLRKFSFRLSGLTCRRSVPTRTSMPVRPQRVPSHPVEEHYPDTRVSDARIRPTTPLLRDGHSDVAGNSLSERTCRHLNA